MKTVRNVIYMSIFGAGICLASCGRNNNQSEGAADPMEESEMTSEMEQDTVVSDTAGQMP